MALASGVEPGELVVLEGMDKIQDGARLTFRLPVKHRTALPRCRRAGAAGGGWRWRWTRRSRWRRSARSEERSRPMNISQPFILRPVATSLLMAGVLLAGVVAYQQLPVSALPQVDYPTIQVVTFYPGASPDVMSSSVTAPLERQFGQVPGLKQMTSTSSFGCSVITLQFALDLNIDIAEQQVQAAINAGGTFLPRDLPNPPIYSKVNPADTPIITLALSLQTLPLSKVEDLADTILAQKISQLPGVGLVRISGGKKPGSADPRQSDRTCRLRSEPRRHSHGAGFRECRSGEGKLRERPTDLSRSAPTIRSWRATTIRTIIVAYRKGAPVRLQDVADVVDDVENTKQAAWMNETPAVIVNIQRQPGANTIEVVDRIKALLPQLKASLPPSVEVSILTDRTTTIRASVTDVQFELMLTIALVVMVMFLFLRNLAGHHYSERCRPAFAGRRFWIDVHVGIQPEQPHADGADHFDGLCRG